MKLSSIFTASTTLLLTALSSSSTASAVPTQSLERRGWFGINILEFNFCRQWTNLGRCLTCVNDKDAAKKDSELSFDAWSLNDNGNGDAFRHCYWSALMTLSTTIDFAKTIGDLHENGDTEQRDKVKKMDLLNNEIGRNCGATAKASKETNKRDAARKCCYDLANAWPPKLYVLKRTQWSPEESEPKCCTF